MLSRLRRGAFALTAFLSLAAAACATIWGFDDFSSEGQDGGGSDVVTDAPSEASAIDAGPCDPDAEFSAPRPVPGITDLGWGSVRSATLTPDELRIYFYGVSPDGGLADIYMASRDGRTERFREPSRLANVSDPALFERDPSISADERFLFFVRQTEDAATAYDLFVASRGSRDKDFTVIEKLRSPMNSPFAELNPFLSADAGELWFVSRRDGGSSRIFRATAGAGGFINPQDIPRPDEAPRNESPVVSSDGKILFYASRTEDGRLFEIWEARREAADGPFAVHGIVSVLNSVGDDYPSWLSPDGCRLYIHGFNNNLGTILMGERTPPSKAAR